ncbi:RibD family protein [Nocardia aobensis]|uniref:RibD family protein n=1 Tax=Nocardia aobensis TaxID=257277 RepID=UPI0002E89A82|nr:dihydrofolate reductase family protein [Nocardia aobensis]
MSRTHVLLSVATSVDGYLDDTSPQRLMLSNEADFDRVDQLRAESDAILVGAETIRRDNPRLTVKSEARKAIRLAAGKLATPRKITVSTSGDLDPEAKFWHHGVDEKPIIYTTVAGAEKLAVRLSDLAEIVPLGQTVDFAALVNDLSVRGIGQLMVEGGGHIHTAFLAAGLADELLMAIGPTLVGESSAPRFLRPAEYPGGPTRRMRLVDVTQIGDVAVLRYHPKEDS